MAQTSNASNDFGYRDAYRAATKGDLDTLLKFCSQHPNAQINASGDTVFHILALNCHDKVIGELLLKLPLHNLMKKENGDGDTALHEAVRVGCVEIAGLMLEKEANLIKVPNKLGETPIFGAAAFGQEKMLRFLSQKPIGENELRRNDGSTILHAAVLGEFYGLALVIMGTYPHLALARNDKGITALHLLAQSPLSFRSGTIYSWSNLGSSSFILLEILAITIYSCVPMDLSVLITKDLENPEGGGNNHQGHQILPQKDRICSGRLKLFIYKTIRRCLPWLKEVVDVKQKHKDALEVVKQLVATQSKQSILNYYINPDHSSASSSALQWNKYDVLSGKNSNNDTDPLLQATKCGIIEVVKEILEEFPDAIEVLDKTGKNILHLVAEYRQDKIFDFLIKSKNVPLMKTLVVDKEGNTPLHLAAKYEFYQQRHVLPVLHLMPWEIFWFKHVRNFSPPQTYHLQNAQHQTPKDLFDETHKGLLQQSERWVKDNTGATMIISVLIATLMFTAALTVPGGFDSNTGLPVLLPERYLTVRYFSLVALSLLFSLVTLAIALYAHSSRFQQEDFYFSLPLKFLFGISTLLVCVILTLMAYAATRFLESGMDFTHHQQISGTFERTIASILAGLVYAEVTFPVYRFLIQVLCQSLSYQK